MGTSKEGTINIVALIIIVIFTVLSCFSCFEFYFTSRVDVDGIVAGTTTLQDEKANNIPVIMILSALQCLFICLRKHSLAVTSMICSIFGVSATAFEALKCFAESALRSMGGLGTSNFRITIIGYLVIGLGFLNVVIQIISLKKSKE